MGHSHMRCTWYRPCTCRSTPPRHPNWGSFLLDTSLHNPMALPKASPVRAGSILGCHSCKRMVLDWASTALEVPVHISAEHTEGYHSLNALQKLQYCAIHSSDSLVLSEGSLVWLDVSGPSCMGLFHTLDRTGSLAMSWMRGGASKGWPLGSRQSAEARSNLKPSTWYSSTHLTV